MQPQQLPLLTSLSAPQVHPGGWAVVASSRPDFGGDCYLRQLWRVPLDGTGARRLTRGTADSAPRLSPDGRLIAFLRPGANDKPQLHLIPADGGEPWCLTNAPLGVSDFAFSPDSSRLVYVAAVPEEGRYGTLEGVGANQEDPRRIEWLQLRMNGEGYLWDKPSHLFLLDVPDPDTDPPLKPVGRAAKALPEGTKPEARLFPTSTQLTSGAGSYQRVVFLSDGATVAAVMGRLADPENLAADLVLVGVGGGEPRPAIRSADEVIDAFGVVALGSGDLAFLGLGLGASGLDFVGRLPGVFRVRTDEGVAHRLTDPDQEFDVDPAAIEGGGLWAVESLSGRSWLVRIDGDTVETVLDDDRVITGVAAVPGRPRAAVISFSSPTSAGDLALVEDGRVVPLTDFSARLRAETTVRAPRELTATAPDGYPVHGWVLVPDGDGPHPVLLAIHGGPQSRYVSSFFDEFQVYAEAGYAVVACNPRGSAGYGSAHARAIQGEFGVKDAADVLAFLEFAVASVPGLDRARVGVMGGSYGGYLTAWLTTIDHRWAGAIVERAYLDPAGFVGSSDIGWFFQHQYNGTPGAQWDAQSPMVAAHRVTTPTLVLHSELDLRCPLSEALRYYTTLKLQGTPVELLVFPGETHELSRSGTPWHRRQRFEAILDWWSRHLPVVR